MTWLAAGRYEGEVQRVCAAVSAALGGDLAGWLRLNPHKVEPAAAVSEAEAKEARADIAAVLGHLNAAAGVTSA